MIKKWVRALIFWLSGETSDQEEVEIFDGLANVRS